MASAMTSAGVFAIDKRSGQMSTDIVNYVKHLLLLPASVKPQPSFDQWKSALQTSSEETQKNKKKFHSKRQKVKIGHGGTLDPLASGVLILGIHAGTKSLHYFLTGQTCRKVYDVTGQFGMSTDTYDVTGKPTLTTPSPVDHITLQAIEDVLKERFTGTIMQRPPAFSALRVNGRRMYDMAREASALNTEVPCALIQPRPVTVHDIRLVSYCPQTQMFSLRVECGGGTYIRSIVHDLGQALGSSAHMTVLRRIRQGPFVVGECEEELEVEGRRKAVSLETLVEKWDVLAEEVIVPPETLKSLGCVVTEQPPTPAVSPVKRDLEGQTAAETKEGEKKVKVDE